MSDQPKNEGEEEFNRRTSDAYDKKVWDFSKTVNIAVVGMVSSGKSSLINAYFGRPKDDPLARVSAESGVQTSIGSGLRPEVAG